MAKSDTGHNMQGRKIANLGKVVVHTKKHKIHRGFSKEDFISDHVRVLDENGNESSFPLKDLKAIFFVKEFTSDPAYDEVLLLGKQQPRPWLWAHVRFKDGEIIEGKVRNGKELIDNSPGFFIWISDQFANSESVFVLKDYVETFSIMG